MAEIAKLPVNRGSNVGYWSARKIVAVLLTLCLAMTLSGCWSRRELSTLGIVGMIGMDKAGNGYLVTIEVLKPQSGEGGDTERTSSYVEAGGLTIANINRNATLKFDRRIFYPHARLYIFAEEVAREGLIKHTDFFFRDHEPRMTTPIYIVRGETVTEVMGIAAGISDTPSEYLLDLWRGQRSNGKSVDVTVLDFVKAYGRPGRNPVVGVVRKVKKHKVMPEEKEAELSVEGAAVFKKDKLVGFLDGDETKGYNWVSGKHANWLAVSPTPEKEGRTVMEVLKLKNDKKVEISSGGVKIKVMIDVRGRLGEETAPGVDMIKPPVIDKLEEAIEQAIKAEVERTLLKVQREYRSDIYGFGEVVHRKNPQEWKNMKDDWDEIFAGAESTVEVKVTLAQSGKSSRSFAK